MDGLPSDPSDQSGNNGSGKIAVPPPFGSSFDPHSNPVDQSNPYQNSIPNPPTIQTTPEDPDPLKHEHYSEVAQHKQRDEHGHFLPSEHPTYPQTTHVSHTPPNSPSPSNPSSFLPPIIEVNQNTEPSSKKDPPLFGFFLTNPVTYLKAFLNKLIKRQAITIKIPVLAIIVFMVGIGGFGVGFSSGMNWAFARLFPNYSPLLHRSITEQGIIQKSTSGDIFLKADDKRSTIWTLKSASANINLEDYINSHVQIRGNLTAIPNLIEVSEVISFDKTIPNP